MTGEALGSQPPMPRIETTEECFALCAQEVQGIGITYMFDASPDDFHLVVEDVIPQHLADSDGLRGSIARFNRFKELIRDYVPYPVEGTEPDFRNPGAPGKVVTFAIDPELPGRYEVFAQALEHYAAAIDACKAGATPQDAAVTAARELCKIIKPGRWDPSVEKGSDEYYASPLRTSTPYWYLDAVLKNSY